MKDLIPALCEESRKAASAFEAFANTDRGTPYTKEIDCNQLEDWQNLDIRESEQYGAFFAKIAQFDGPSLYWFEIVSDTPRAEILDALRSYGSKGERPIPSIKKLPPLDTDVLYVGKVVKGSWGRLIAHLGYFNRKNVHGLQLYHWTRELNLQLRFHVYEAAPEMYDYMEILERRAAKELRPLVGRH